MKFVIIILVIIIVFYMEEILFVFVKFIIEEFKLWRSKLVVSIELLIILFFDRREKVVLV